MSMSNEEFKRGLEQAMRRADEARVELDLLPEYDPRLRLSHRQIDGMRRLIAGMGPEQVASKLEISPVVVRRWLTSPRFRKAVRAQREAPLSDAVMHQLLRRKRAARSNRKDGQ